MLSIIREPELVRLPPRRVMLEVPPANPFMEPEFINCPTSEKLMLFVFSIAPLALLRLPVVSSMSFAVSVPALLFNEPVP